MTRPAIVAALVATIAASGACAQAAERPSLAERWNALKAEVFDPADGQFDLGAVLERAHGFLPVPIVITEPAVGFGGGLVAMFVRPRHQAGKEGFARPDISAVGGAFTENGTRVFVAGDSSLWLDGRLKTTAGVVGGDVNLDIYGLGSTSSEQGEAIRYTLATRAASSAGGRRARMRAAV